MQRALRGRHGFNLVEVFLVAGIVALLVALAAVSFQWTVAYARQQALAHGGRTLLQAFLDYRALHHACPSLDPGNLSPLTRTGALDDAGWILGMLEGRALSSYQAGTGPGGEGFWAILAHAGDPQVRILVADTDEFPGHEGERLAGVYLLRAGDIELLDTAPIEDPSTKGAVRSASLPR